jgi:hypothetical protein
MKMLFMKRLFRHLFLTLHGQVLSEALIVEEILHQAEQLEKEYDWSGAAGSYEKALNLLPRDDFLKRGEFHERLGYAFYRFAFQAESKDEFRRKAASIYSCL